MFDDENVRQHEGEYTGILGLVAVVRRNISNCSTSMLQQCWIKLCHVLMGKDSLYNRHQLIDCCGLIKMNQFRVLLFYCLFLFTFSILTCMMGDVVRSKPWLGLLGNLSAVMATCAAFGLAMYLRIDFIGINLAAPFLMIGEYISYCICFRYQNKRTHGGMAS